MTRVLGYPLKKERLEQALQVSLSDRQLLHKHQPVSHKTDWLIVFISFTQKSVGVAGLTSFEIKSNDRAIT